MSQAFLVLQDGTVFEGTAFGATGEAVGEVVFNTSMTGYQEILTDASYRGQIVTMTYTQIGNYGVNDKDIESGGGPQVEGFVVKEYLDYPSNWRSRGPMSDYLAEHGITGIEDIDTRALTRHIRTYGAQMGIISSSGAAPEDLYQRIRKHRGIGGIDLVKDVTAPDMYTWDEGVWKWESPPSTEREKLSVVVYDFGVKRNILRNLTDAGFDVTVVPAHTPAETVLDLDPRGILLSNGPGDPEAVTYGVENAGKLIGKKPLFGICLGHQILGLALGGSTYKLKFGHHGGNHPVQDLRTGKVEITSQNHNYCVDVRGLGDQVHLTFRNLYDGTEEGMEHVELPIMSVQHHPEAGPGPHDARHVFHRFREMVEKA